MGWNPIKWVQKAVKKVVKWVGNAVEDVVDFVVDDILEPVIETVSGVVQGMLDDPLTTLATFAAMIIPGAQWTIPLIQGASTAIKGGDLGDIAISMAASYAGAQAGAAVGKAVGSSVSSQAAGMGFQVSTQSATANIAAQAASQATTGAIRAVAAGGDLKDIGKAAFSGAVFGAATAGASEVGDYLFPTDYATGEGADTALGFKVDADAFDRFNDLSSSIGNELTALSRGWDKLPDTVQEVIKDGAAASVTSLIRYGEISEEEVAAAVARAVVTTNITANTLQQIPGLNDKQASVISKVASDVISSAYIDADPYEVYQASISGATLGDLHAEIDDVTGGGLNRIIDLIDGSSADYTEKLQQAELRSELVNDARTKYNDKLEEIQKADEEYKIRVKDYNDRVRHGSKAEADAYKAEHITSYYNKSGDTVSGKSQILRNELNELRTDYEVKYGGFNAAQAEFTMAKDKLWTDQKYLEDIVAPIKQDFTKQIVEQFTTDPLTNVSKFNEEEYRELYNLSPSDSPHEHYLQHGTRLAVSKDDFRGQVADVIARVVPNDFLDQITNYDSSLSRTLSELETYEGMIDYIIENKIGSPADFYARQAGFGFGEEDVASIDDIVSEGIQEWQGYEPLEELPAIISQEQRDAEAERLAESQDLEQQRIDRDIKVQLGGDIRRLLEAEESGALTDIPKTLINEEGKQTPIIIENPNYIAGGEEPRWIEDRVSVYDQTLDEINARYGGAAGFEDLLKEYFPDQSLVEIVNTVDNLPLVELAAIEPAIGRDEGVTDNDIATGDARLRLEELTDYRTRSAENINRAVEEIETGAVDDPLYQPPSKLKFSKEKDTYWRRNVWVPELRRYAAVALQKVGEYIPELTSSAEAAELFPLYRTPGVADPRNYYKAVLLDPVSFEPIEGWSNGAITSRGLEFPRGEGAPTVAITTLGPPEVPTTLYELKQRDPYVAMNVAGDLEVDPEVYKNVPWVMRRFIDYSMHQQELMREHEANIGKYGDDRLNEYYDAEWVDNERKRSANVIDAYAEYIKAFNDSYFYKKLFVDPRVKPGETGTAIGTDVMADIANEIRPESYKELIAKGGETYFKIAKEEGALQAAYWVLQQAVKTPWSEGKGDFGEVIRREWIAKEVLQELPNIVASLGVGKAVYSGVKYGLKGSKYAIDQAKELARKWSFGGAITTEVGLSALETAGSTANEAYNTIFPELMKSGRYTEEQAELEATRMAIGISASATFVEMSLGNILNPSAIVVKKILSKGINRQITDEIAERGAKEIAEEGAAKWALKRTARIGAISIAEGTSEAIEESLALNMQREALQTLVPESDIFLPGGWAYGEDWDALQAVTGITAMVTGMGTAGTIAAVDNTINVMDDTVTPRYTPILPDGSPIIDYTFDTGDPIGNMIVNGNVDVNIAMHETQSDDPAVREQGVQTLKDTFNWDGLAADVNAAMGPDATDTFIPYYDNTLTSYDTALNILNTASPDTFTTYNEATGAFSENQTPYEYSESELYNFTGQTPTSELQEQVDTHIDEGYTDEAEVKATFAEQGYTPTEEEITERVGQTVETETLSEIAPYVDPRQTTTDEIAAYFEEQGYTPSSEDIATFVGQGGPDFETETGEEIAPYVDPRQTTRPEVAEFFRTEGYTPTEAELLEYISQGGPDFQTETGRAVTERYDPLAVLPQEVRDVYTSMGLDAPITAKDAERLAGQYPEAELEGRATEYLDIATANSIAEIVGKQGNEVTQADVDFVTDLLAQREVLTEAGTAPQPFTSQELAYDVTGDNVIDINDQNMLEQVMTGTVPQTEIALQSPFAATGIQGQLQQQIAMQQQMAQQMAQQIAGQQEAQRRTQQQQYLTQLMETTPVQVKTPPPAEIKYVYDPFEESVFATPQQEAMFTDPYSGTLTNNMPTTIPMQTAAKGGIIKDKTDEILRILGENK